ncbi:hypothetical protein [Pseudoruegeria sp. HB172150]|uniref:hypothetical protein n=1 Tax=Pseudoruegeria sp. HB172150 TaxID=2721164 RepID=UPI0015574FBC|nr:hypothetical protein [Pseudoruegeria sp. HB172150]
MNSRNIILAVLAVILVGVAIFYFMDDSGVDDAAMPETTGETAAPETAGETTEPEAVDDTTEPETDSEEADTENATDN